ARERLREPLAEAFVHVSQLDREVAEGAAAAAAVLVLLRLEAVEAGGDAVERGRARGLRQGIQEADLQLIHPPVEDRVAEGLLAREVIVEGALLHVRALEEVPDRGAAEAALADQRRRVGEHVLATGGSARVRPRLD